MIQSAGRQGWGRKQGALPLDAELLATKKIRGEREPLASAVCPLMNPPSSNGLCQSSGDPGPKTKAKVRKARKATGSGEEEEDLIRMGGG